MTDLTRRNFLRGIVAAAGVAAVGLPTLLAIASEAPPPALPFLGDAGDVFMKVNGVWRFVSRATNISYRFPDPAEIRAKYPNPRPGYFIDCHEINVTSYFDEEGYRLIGEALSGGLKQDFAFTLHKESIATVTSIVQAMQISTFTHHGITQIDASLRSDQPMKRAAPIQSQSLPASVRGRNETGARFHKKSNKFSDSQSTG